MLSSGMETQLSYLTWQQKNPFQNRITIVPVMK